MFYIHHKLNLTFTVEHQLHLFCFQSILLNHYNPKRNSEIVDLQTNLFAIHLTFIKIQLINLMNMFYLCFKKSTKLQPNNKIWTNSCTQFVCCLTNIFYSLPKLEEKNMFRYLNKQNPLYLKFSSSPFNCFSSIIFYGFRLRQNDNKKKTKEKSPRCCR